MNPLVSVSVYQHDNKLFQINNPFMNDPVIDSLFRKIHSKKADKERGLVLQEMGYLIKRKAVNSFDVAIISSECSLRFIDLVFKQAENLLNKHENMINFDLLLKFERLIIKDNVTDTKSVFFNDGLANDQEFVHKNTALFEVFRDNKKEKVEQKETDILQEIHSNIVFDFVKDEPVIEPINKEEVISELDNLEISESIAFPKLNEKEQSQKIRQERMEIEIKPKEVEVTVVKTIPRLVLKEKLDISVEGVKIINKIVTGRISIENLVNGLDYLLEMLDTFWANEYVIRHTLADYPPNIVKIENKMGGILFSLAEEFKRDALRLYEYRINPSLLDSSTIPFMLAYQISSMKLRLRVSINKKHWGSFVGLQLRFRFSGSPATNEIQSSHPGSVIGRCFLIIFEQDQLQTEHIMVEILLKDSELNFESVRALGSLSVCMVPLDPNLTNLAYQTSDSEVVSLLDVDYMLTIN